MKKILTVLLTLPLMVFADPVLTKDNTLSFNGEFTPSNVAKTIKEARDLDSRTTSQDPIYLVLNSPGGSIMAGLELIDNLSNLKRPVKTLSLFSASMGFQTVQGLGERLVTSGGTLMSHRPSGGFSGEFPGQLDTRYAYILKKIQRMNQKVVKRTNGKQTLKSYTSLIQDEYWCDGQECVNDGFADRVVAPTCDKSLSGSKWVTVEEAVVMGIYLQLKLEFENCPLNTNYLRSMVYIDGEPLVKDQKEDSMFSFDTKPKISEQALFEIQKKVNETLLRIENKEVIKGY